MPDLAEWLKQRASLTAMIQQQLARAQQRMKSQVEVVYLKLQPYVQSTVATRTCHKLSFRFYGPYKILQKVGEVAYKLDLPQGSRIHPVVHVSQLKKHISAHQPVSTDLSSVNSESDAILEPIYILNSRLVPHAGASAAIIKVQWGEHSTALITEEDEADLRCRYPTAPAWGQAGSQGVGNVMTKRTLRRQQAARLLSG